MLDGERRYFEGGRRCDLLALALVPTVEVEMDEICGR